MRNTLTPKTRLFTFLGAALPVTFNGAISLSTRSC